MKVKKAEGNSAVTAALCESCGRKGSTVEIGRNDLPLPKTIAARASHPSRIVIVDALIAHLSLERKTIAQLHS
jgi:hypothetical protein